MGILDRFKKKPSQLGKPRDNSSAAYSARPSVLRDRSPSNFNNPAPEPNTPPSHTPPNTPPSHTPPNTPLTNPPPNTSPLSNITPSSSSYSPSPSKDFGGDILGVKKKINEGDAPIKITIMNGKGGSGKSTLATNLATVLSTHANSVTLIDNDPQCSSIRWLKERPHSSIPIKGLTASEVTGLRNIKLWTSGIGPETRYVIIDTQAGLRGMELSDAIDRSDMIIIPVLPSAIDMRATADFVAQLFLSKSYRRTRKPIGVVANRVINDSIIYRKLQKFLLSLRINFISTFNDNKAYLWAAEKGVGIFELNEPGVDREKVEWDLLLKWVEDKKKAVQAASSR